MKMNRRSFLSTVAALPFMGWAGAKADLELIYGGSVGGAMEDSLPWDANTYLQQKHIRQFIINWTNEIRPTIQYKLRGRRWLLNDRN